MAPDGHGAMLASMRSERETDFPVLASWFGDDVAYVRAHDKVPLRVAPSGEEPGFGGAWSPEELLVAAVAADFELTLASVARRRRVPLRVVTAEAVGRVDPTSASGRALVAIELDVELETTAGREGDAGWIARRAAHSCAIGRALGVPIRLSVATCPAAAAVAAA